MGTEKKLCELLRTKYPNTQFIITTHEKTWFKQMQTAKLIDSKSALQFCGWTVDGGPQIVGVLESWDAIKSTYESTTFHSGLAAASKNYLEYISLRVGRRLGCQSDLPCDWRTHGSASSFQSVCTRFRELLKKLPRLERVGGTLWKSNKDA